MNGEAPNWSLTGSHTVLPRNPKPKARKLGNALIASTTAMSARSTRIAKHAAPEPAWKRRSPQDDPVGCRIARRVPRRKGKTMGDLGPGSGKEGHTVKGNRANRRHVQGYDRRGQRRVRQRGRGGLRDVVDRPSEEVDERLRLRLGHPGRIDVQLLVHQEVGQRGDRVAARARGVRD